MKWLKHLFFRRRRYDDLSVSIQEHLEEKIEELMGDGMPRKEATQTARREFGNVTLLEQRGREVWQWPAVETFGADIKHALRRVGKSPVFAATVILTLAIGIGANTAVFSVLDSVLLKPLPYPRAEELVGVRLNAPGAAGLATFADGLRLSPSMYFTFAEQNRSFQSFGVWTTGTANVTGLAQPEQVHTAQISDGVLQALNVPPAAGRWLLPEDQSPHHVKTVMLSYGYWQRHFAGDRSAIGRSVTVDSQLREIVGVMPRGFRLVNADFDLIVPLAFDRNQQILAGFGYLGIARLKPEATIVQADADVARMVPIWMRSWSNGPGTDPLVYETWRIVPALRLLKAEVIGDVGGALWLVMGTIGIVMLITCANVANLLMVRAEARQQELAIRAALGAGQRRIMRELLIESVLLGLIGGVLGVGIANAGLRLLVATSSGNLPRVSEISLDARALGFTLILSLLSGLFLGLIPAFKYARPRIVGALGSAGRTASANRERHYSRNFLVVAQVAMAMVLLVSAGLLIRTFQQLQTVEPGFADAEHLETMRISIPESLVADPRLVTRIQNNITDKLAAIPGVTSVGFANAMPMEGIAGWDGIYVEGKDYGGAIPPLRLFKNVSPGLFHTMGTRLVAGREFTWAEVYGLRPEAILSANLARELWGSPSAAIGKRFTEFSGMPWHEVIGVVEDVHENGVQEMAPAIVYWPSMMNGLFGPHEGLGSIRTASFAVRSDRAGTESLLNEIRQAVWSVNPNLPLASLETMQDRYSQSLARTSFTLMMLGIAGGMALVLGIIGIYGVISYAVSQRRREIGIRLALGAQQGELQWMFIRSGLALTAIGVAIGLGAAAGLMRLIESQLFGISPLDPLTYIVVPLVLAASAVLASYLPARRVAAVDPVEALKAE